jgi:proline racemase
VVTGSEVVNIVNDFSGPDTQEHLDDVRAFLVNEPRGHADMYGCFVTEPVSPQGDLGVLFFHNAGFSTACGHGTIALATYALDAGVLAAGEPETELVIDVPSGALPVVASVADGRVSTVRFRNVPSFVHADALRVATSRGELTVDIAFGGAFYASVAVEQAGLAVEPRDLPALVELGREVKRQVEAAGEVVHPDEPELRDVYGVIFFQEEGRDPLVQRNVTVFADGEVDRSPCGSGTSARLALLHARGDLGMDEPLLHRGIVGTEFVGRVVGETPAGVVTEVGGSAHRTGEHRFVLDADDPLSTGFLLR